jgi:hypothetical protein
MAYSDRTIRLLLNLLVRQIHENREQKKLSQIETVIQNSKSRKTKLNFKNTVFIFSVSVINYNSSVIFSVVFCLLFFFFI